MTANYPVLLNLRGNFVDPYLQQVLPMWFPRLASIVEVKRDFLRFHEHVDVTCMQPKFYYKQPVIYCQLRDEKL
ncbi:hypothetical protein KDW_38860 [Dictyobacter vulcani]|uniref:Uncharacterized protein n=1 Tax=Dictyobacter vulcani TaxID=2607529 RepID=A0A5J4KJQ0_9CHLR|nr:hypothetical protein KDW_38860 [Dictyobacter vulcani]